MKLICVTGLRDRFGIHEVSRGLWSRPVYAVSDAEPEPPASHNDTVIYHFGTLDGAIDFVVEQSMSQVLVESREHRQLQTTD